MNPPFDQQARAHWRDAQAHLSVRTIAELHRRRIAVCSADDVRRRAPRWLGWPLASALGGAGALALCLGLLLPQLRAPDAPPAITVAAQEMADASLTALADLDASDALDALDALDTLDLTALDEDSEFFLWLSSHETTLLAME